MSNFKPTTWTWDCGKYGTFEIEHYQREFRVKYHFSSAADEMWRAATKPQKKTIWKPLINYMHDSYFITFKECVSWCEEALEKIKEVLE